MTTPVKCTRFEFPVFVNVWVCVKFSDELKAYEKYLLTNKLSPNYPADHIWELKLDFHSFKVKKHMNT